MKKLVFCLLAAALLISGFAMAQERLADSSGSVDYVACNGLLRIEGDRVQKVYSGDVQSVQVCGDTVYFVVSELVNPQEERPHYNSLRYDTLMAMDAGGNVRQIGAPRLRGEESVWNDSYGYVSYVWHSGYQDMQIHRDHIYFIGDDGIAGSYVNRRDANDYYPEPDAFESTYATGAGVYRMDLDGGNLQLLIPALGNGGAQMDIAGNRIAVAAVYRNTVNPYDYADFRFYDLQGKLVQKYKNQYGRPQYWYYMDGMEFTELVYNVRTDGKDIYVSMSDSEGDFNNGRMAKADELYRVLYYEAHFTPSVLTESGHIALLSDAPDEFYSWEAENTSRLCRLGNDGTLKTLAFVPDEIFHTEQGWWDPLIGVAGDRAYVILGEQLLRVRVSGGTVQKLVGDAFVDAPEYAPENYVPVWDYLLPDSNIHLYTSKELKAYDRETLGFMRNEILARHGYIFSKQKYIDHFESQPWYYENEYFEYSDLNSVEMKNIETIKALEN